MQSNMYGQNILTFLTSQGEIFQDKDKIVFFLREFKHKSHELQLGRKMAEEEDLASGLC